MFIIALLESDHQHDTQQLKLVTNPNKIPQDCIKASMGHF